MIKIKFPPKRSIEEIQNFFKKNRLEYFIKSSREKKVDINQMTVSSPLIPQLADLYRLYEFIILNKRTTVLEFGSGWSSVIIHLALYKLKKKYTKELENLRRNNPFELFILENSKKYLGISKKRIDIYNKFLKKRDIPKVHYCFSDIEMTTFNDLICTKYKKLPLCNPDFIYLDGPDQYNIKKDVNGISTRHIDMMPMVSDILRLEFFFTPGTIILTDGRSANVKFLEENFKRNWKHKRDEVNDQHIFWLDESSLGKYNSLQLNFYKKS